MFGYIVRLREDDEKFLRNVEYLVILVGNLRWWWKKLKYFQWLIFYWLYGEKEAQKQHHTWNFKIDCSSYS